MIYFLLNTVSGLGGTKRISLPVRRERRAGVPAGICGVFGIAVEVARKEGADGSN